MSGVLLATLALLLAVAPRAEVRNVRISSPKLLLSREKAESPVQVVGQFKVEMSFAANTARKPVARLSCLCDFGGTLRIDTRLLDRPNTVAAMGTGEILQGFKAAGIEVDAKRREEMCADPALFTPHLREVSKDAYLSAVYGSVDLKRGFFRLGKAATMPKILLYRIEIWQNGVLVAKYESSRSGLASYEIPADWHVWKKYPQKFRYGK